jgi:hypothetical protein
LISGICCKQCPSAILANRPIGAGDVAVGVCPSNALRLDWCPQILRLIEPGIDRGVGLAIQRIGLALRIPQSGNLLLPPCCAAASAPPNNNRIVP